MDTHATIYFIQSMIARKRCDLSLNNKIVVICGDSSFPLYFCHDRISVEISFVANRNGADASAAGTGILSLLSREYKQQPSKPNVTYTIHSNRMFSRQCA